MRIGNKIHVPIWSIFNGAWKPFLRLRDCCGDSITEVGVSFQFRFTRPCRRRSQWRSVQTSNLKDNLWPRCQFHHKRSCWGLYTFRHPSLLALIECVYELSAMHTTLLGVGLHSTVVMMVMENTVAETIRDYWFCRRSTKDHVWTRKDRVWSTASIVQIAYGPHKYWKQP